MKICVTGGAGFIGSHTCKLLAESGHEVFVYDNLSTGHRDAARWGEFFHGDIRDTQTLRSCFRRVRPDGVIHFAGYINVGESVTEPGKYFSNNVGGSLSLLEAMRDENVPAIVVSGSCAVYGEPKTVPIAEDCPKAPINTYGASKLVMEWMLADFARAYGLSWMSLRYFNAAGCSPEGEIGERHEPETHLIPRVIKAALGELDAIDIYGDDYPTPDGTCIRDYIHVEDLAKAHLLAMKHLLDAKPSMALNLGTGTGYSVREIIDGVSRLAGKPVPTRIIKRREGDPPRLVADSSKVRETLGWQPEKNLEQSLEDAWNFLKARQRAKA